MNKLKSVFITPYIMYLMVASVVALVYLFSGSHLQAWLATLLTSGAGFVFFGLLMLQRTPRTGRYVWGVTLPMLIGAVWLLTLWIAGISVPVPALILTGIAVAGWALYIFWYSDFEKRDDTHFQLEQSMPAVQLEDAEGNPVSTEAFNNHPTIFLFYRGNWCPFCMAQIRELAEQYREIEERGAQLVLISPQSQKHTKELANRFNIPAKFLIDKDLSASKQLGIFQEDGTPSGMGMMGFENDTVMPTVVVTDADGIVRYADLADNYRLRPEPQEYLRILDSIEQPAAGAKENRTAVCRL